MTKDGSSQHTLTRQELYDAVWAKPMRDVARDLGVSDVGLAKICRRHAIPTPERGYWLKVRHGKVVPRPALRDPSPAEAGPILIAPSRKEPLMGPKQTLTVAVGPRLPDPHPLVAKTLKALAAAKADENGRVRPGVADALPVCVAPSSAARAARLLQALVTTFECRGHAVACGEAGRRRRIVTSVNGESVVIELSEELDRAERPLTRAEQAQRERSPWLYPSPRYVLHPNGRLRIGIDHYTSFGLRRVWRDGTRQRLEQCVGEFVLQVERFAVALREDRRRREERMERQRAWEAERAEKLREIAEEEERLRALDAEVEAWLRSQRIRQYIEVVRDSATRNGGDASHDTELGRWLAWATAQADRFDPLAKSPPSIIDEKRRWASSYFLG